MKDRPLLGIVVFLYVWLMVGFASGTGVLLGPARWVTAWTRARGWATGEDVAMLAVIGLYVVGSFFVSRFLARRMHLGRRVARISIPVVVTALAGASFYGWSDPARLARLAGGDIGGTLDTSAGAQFLFGAYPDYDKLRDLKRHGITHVISLQSPAVVPIEPQGIAAEREAARRLGIDFVDVPMLPWVSDNEEALRRIAAIADTARGSYYVHCGLGRDRANVVKNFLETRGAKVGATGDLLAANSLADRKIPMERGWPVQLAQDVWLVPYPNQAEMFGYFLAGQFRTAVSLLDPTRPDELPWIREAARLLPDHGVRLLLRPVLAGTASGELAAAEAARLVRSLPRPVVVIVPATSPNADTVPARAFIAAWRSRTATPATLVAGVPPTSAEPPAPVAAAAVRASTRGVRSGLRLHRVGNVPHRHPRRAPHRARRRPHVAGVAIPWVRGRPVRLSP